jgi:hypothetical protein
LEKGNEKAEKGTGETAATVVASNAAETSVGNSMAKYITVSPRSYKRLTE